MQSDDDNDENDQSSYYESSGDDDEMIHTTASKKEVRNQTMSMYSTYSITVHVNETDLLLFRGWIHPSSKGC